MRAVKRALDPHDLLNPGKVLARRARVRASPRGREDRRAAAQPSPARRGVLLHGDFDATIVTTSAPKIGAALHVRPTAVGLVITSYLVTLAVLIPLSGWLAPRYGPRPVFLSAITIFTLASLGCAASTSLGSWSRSASCRASAAR